jgi:hypothetical protein
MDLHHYLELDPTRNEFRLFTLKPGAAGCNIEGILEHYPLQTSPSYHGLSYVWGNPKDTQAILVDGHSLSEHPISMMLFSTFETPTSRSRYGLMRFVSTKVTGTSAVSRFR